MAKTTNFPGIGKFHVPPEFQRPCKAAQWNDGVFVAGLTSSYNPSLNASLNDIPVGIAPDGLGGAFVLTILNQNWFVAPGQGPFALRPITATGRASSPILFGDPSGWVGLLGQWSEAVVVPSGPGRCILAGGKTQTGFGSNILDGQRFDQSSTPLWNGGNPVPVSTAFPGTPGQPSPNNLVGEPDGNDGAIFGWLMWSPLAGNVDYTIQVQRIASNGNRLWGTDGLSFGSAPGPIAYNQASWIQLVPYQNGGAIVLTPSGATNRYEAYVIDQNGTLISGPDVVVSGIPNEWIAFQRLRRAVTDGKGGLFLAYADSTNRLHVLRYQPAAGMAWDITLEELFHPASFYVCEDDREGVLVTFLSAKGLLELRRIANNGTTTWDINQAAGGLPLQPILPSSSRTWGAHQWSRFAQAMPKGDGGVILIFQFFANRNFPSRLHTICFDSMGAPVNPEQQVTRRPTTQDCPLAIAVGGAAIVAWADDGNLMSTGWDVWAQRVGCCPPAMGGLEPWPPFGCEIIDFSGGGFDEMILKFPCGNNGLRFGVIPLSRLVSKMSGLDFPGSLTNRDVPSPDWMRIHFYGVPEKTRIRLFDTKGKMICEAQRNVLTFKPSDNKEDQLLIFTSELDTISIHIRTEWGDGNPPAPHS
jgi:hypothetical protein